MLGTCHIMTKIAVLQMSSGIEPEENVEALLRAIEAAAVQGAAMLFTPEYSGLIDQDQERASCNVAPEEDNSTLTQICEAARRHSLWVSLGSLAMADPSGRWINRSYVIDAGGQIVARYDKMHMFDVDLAGGESWRESDIYRAGDQISVVQTPVGKLGLSICYDIRFPALFDALGRAGCDAIAIPAAFTRATGEAHWHILQRARAIESSCYVIAAAQSGTHADGRETFGHSLVIDPWGEIILEIEADGPNLGFAEIDAERIAKVRSQLPSLANRRDVPAAIANGASLKPPTHAGKR